MPKKNVLIFAGTSEGRDLALFLDRQGVCAHICVATAYGRQLLEELHTRHVLHEGRLDCAAMQQLIRSEHISITVDATHPYAQEVSRNIRFSCRQTGCRYLRLERSTGTTEDSGQPPCVTVDSVAAAAAYLKERPGNILVTTGAKELEAYTGITGYRERVYVRVLSVPESVEKASALGFQGRNLICMQGPFSAELNEAMLREIHADWLVTKESGAAGGFMEKCVAAERTGAGLVVVRRPEPAPIEEDPVPRYSLPAVRRILIQQLELTVCGTVTLAGIGMGSVSGFTGQVLEAVRSADVWIGAGRMLQAALEAAGSASRPSLRTEVEEYRAQQIAAWLIDHPEAERVVVLLSGDSGFYSAAKKLGQLLRQQEKEVTILPGISSVSCLAARLQTGYEDAQVVSIHGRSQNVIGAVRKNRKVFVLAGREESFRALLQELVRFGLGQVQVYAGAELSSPRERILQGRAEDFPKEPLGDLVTVLIRNPDPKRVVTHGLEDAAFLRKMDSDASRLVPMTRMEVRALSLSKLQLTPDSVIWDVGAGTGSVSVECALQAPQGRVYAVECREDAAQLIERNCETLCAGNVTVVRGSAPGALEGLPAPTHVFIGGSNGSMRPILERALQANCRVRVVINAIALETLAQALSCLRELPFSEPDITQLSAARAREVAQLHMMMGANPVYVIAAEGSGTP